MSHSNATTSNEGRPATARDVKLVLKAISELHGEGVKSQAKINKQNQEMLKRLETCEQLLTLLTSTPEKVAEKIMEDNEAVSPY